MESGRPLVFDLDGTLWDSTEVVARAWNLALQESGLQFGPLCAADIASIMGMTHEQIRQRLFPDLDPGHWHQFSQLAYQREEELLREHGGQLYAGVRETLTRLAERHPLGIVSNCQKGYIEVFLEWTGLRGLFEDWECHGNTGLNKGENLLQLCRRRNWSGVVYVGDTAGDEAAARQAGYNFLFAAYGFGQASGQAPVLSSFEELLLVAA